MGSSPKMISGRLARARATATRCCWPPESSLGRWREAVAEADGRRRPWSSHALSGLRPARAIGRVMFSRAVSVGTRLNAWKMKPILSRRSSVSRVSSSVGQVGVADRDAGPR